MAEQETPKIPNRLFFRIGDVSELSGVEPYVLRFWEGEFPTLSPKKTSSGQRQYRRKDVETILEIKRLLYDERYTIAGARKALRGKRKQKRAVQTEGQAALPFASGAGNDEAHLSEIKQQLESILSILDKK